MTRTILLAIFSVSAAFRLHAASHAESPILECSFVDDATRILIASHCPADVG